MGEIKSTLDLVMEKTKHLTLSKEERKQQQSDEIRQRIRGLLQKFHDQVFTPGQLQAEYQNLKKDNNLSDNKLFMEEILERLDFDRDNQLFLDLLEDDCDVNTGNLKTALDDYQKAIRTAAGKRQAELKETLAREYFISGSAVVPNLQADDTWRAKARTIRSGFEQQLNEEKDRIRHATG